MELKSLRAHHKFYMKEMDRLRRVVVVIGQSTAPVTEQIAALKLINKQITEAAKTLHAYGDAIERELQRQREVAA